MNKYLQPITIKTIQRAEGELAMSVDDYEKWVKFTKALQNEHTALIARVCEVLRPFALDDATSFDEGYGSIAVITRSGRAILDLVDLESAAALLKELEGDG